MLDETTNNHCKLTTFCEMVMSVASPVLQACNFDTHSVMLLEGSVIATKVVSHDLWCANMCVCVLWLSLCC